MVRGYVAHRTKKGDLKVVREYVAHRTKNYTSIVLPAASFPINFSLSTYLIKKKVLEEAILKMYRCHRKTYMLSK